MIDKLLVNLGLKYVAAKLDGKKTYFGAAVLVLMGLGKIAVALVAIIGTMYPDLVAPAMETDQAIDALQDGAALIGAGLATVGIGHKVEKNA